ncbi:MAG: hydrolase [Alphaproteobacteria bacterium]|nr:hydrolase [Alphaproteobacteria bacterium]
MLLNASKSLLLVIDIQEKLFPLQAEKELILKGTEFLLDVAQILTVPSILSEQYPKGLGKTISEIDVYNLKSFEKTCFSCAEDEPIVEYLKSTKRSQIVIVGMEAHICVLQTAIGLQMQGFQVFVVEDAISSRQLSDKKAALKRMTHCAVQIVTKEMVTYEWLHRSGTDAFNEINHMIKNQ